MAAIRTVGLPAARKLGDISIKHFAKALGETLEAIPGWWPPTHNVDSGSENTGLMTGLQGERPVHAGFLPNIH